MSLRFYFVCGAFLLTILLTPLFGFLHFNRNHQENRKRDTLVLLSMGAISMPLFLFVSFVYVFYQGGSNVAQFSYHRYDLWDYWFSLYLPCFGCSIIAALLAFVALLMELQPMKQPYSFWCRASTALSFLPTFFVLLTTMPDA